MAYSVGMWLSDGQRNYANQHIARAAERTSKRDNNVSAWNVHANLITSDGTLANAARLGKSFLIHATLFT